MKILVFLSIVLTLLCSGSYIAHAECANWECECTNGNVSEVGSKKECVAECGGASKVKSVTPPECPKAPADVFAPAAFIQNQGDCERQKDRCAQSCERMYGGDDVKAAACERKCASVCSGDAPLLPLSLVGKTARDGNQCTPDYIASECDACNLEPKCTKKCIHDLGCD